MTRAIISSGAIIDGVYARTGLPGSLGATLLPGKRQEAMLLRLLPAAAAAVAAALQPAWQLCDDGSDTVSGIIGGVVQSNDADTPGEGAPALHPVEVVSPTVIFGCDAECNTVAAKALFETVLSLHLIMMCAPAEAARYTSESAALCRALCMMATPDAADPGRLVPSWL